jgi:hypothetical protein
MLRAPGIRAAINAPSLGGVEGSSAPVITSAGAAIR